MRTLFFFIFTNSILAQNVLVTDGNPPWARTLNATACITKYGTFTAAHVIQNSGGAILVSGSLERIDCLDETTDVAFLKEPKTDIEFSKHLYAPEFVTMDNQKIKVVSSGLASFEVEAVDWIVPGSSGSGCFDEKGRLVGILTSWIPSRNTIRFTSHIVLRTLIDCKID